ncbi:MAG TPA: HEAT repeat domain-containing protein, partial [Longimicrobiales bacterium]
ELRKTALFWAGQVGAVEAPDLRTMYGTLSDPDMKEQAVFVLSQMKGAAAVDALMHIADTETDRELKERAIFWLGQSDDPRVPEFLLRIIRGGEA